MRRAGLDYWKHLNLSEYDSWTDFVNKRSPKHLMFFENYAKNSFFEAKYPREVFLVFGSETKGLPEKLIEGNLENTYHLPMYSKHIRSLNLSNVVTAVSYQCLRSQLIG